jgi:hypothetical protein
MPDTYGQPPTELPHPATKQRILDAVRREPSPTRPRVQARVAAIVCCAIVGGLALFFLSGGVRPGPRPPGFIVNTAIGSIVISFLAVWGAFGRGRSMLGRSRRVLFTILFVTPAMLYGWMLFCTSRFHGIWIWQGEREPGCVLLSLSLSVWPLALIAIARPEIDPLHPALSGAARGCAVGALAWVLVTLWCPVSTPLHIAAGHVSPMFLLAGYGAWLGRKWTSVSRSTT